MPRIWLPSALVLAALLLPSGCASSSDDTAVPDAVFGWFGVASRGDCEKLKALSLAPADLDLCAAVTKDRYSPMPSLYTVDTEIDGNQALARISSGGQGRKILLLRVNNSWRVIYPLQAP